MTSTAVVRMTLPILGGYASFSMRSTLMSEENDQVAKIPAA